MGTVKSWFKKYLYHSIPTLCIRGLIFSHSLVNHGIVNILIVYLTSNWTNQHFQIAAAVTNVQDGILDIMVILLAHFSNTYRGSFNIIVTTNAAYIAGLAILWRSAQHMTADTAAKVYYGAVLLLILGEAGRSAALTEFLDNQYLWERERGKKKDLEYEKLRDRQDALWSLPWLLGAIIPLFLVKTTWEQIFQISTIVVGVFYLLFCCGYSSYFINSSARKPAARENLLTLIEKMKKTTDFHKRIFTLWLTFLVYSVVTAAGNTFFYEQTSNLRIPIKNYDIAVYCNVISSVSKYAISYLWELKVPKRQKLCTLVRIGCGLACAVLCCVTAWHVEIRRLNEVKRQGVGDTSDVIPMSIFWLVPQFSLLGIMEGLAVDGLIDFFVERVAGSDEKAMIRYYASHTSDFVIGVGKVLTAISILAFRRRWFEDSINMSRLDKYYRALTFMSLIGFCFYLFCAYFFYDTNDKAKESYSGEEENETSSHKTEKYESSPPSPHEPSEDIQQEPQDLIHHQQPPPPLHQPPPLQPQYYLPQYPPPPPPQAYPSEQSYLQAPSFQPQYPAPPQAYSPYPQAQPFQQQQYPPQFYDSYTPQSRLPVESYPPQPYQPQTYNTYPSQSGMLAEMYPPQS